MNAKIVQVNAIKACFYIAERRLSYAKIVQVNAIKACFYIAERRLSYAKIATMFYNLVAKCFCAV